MKRVFVGLSMVATLALSGCAFPSPVGMLYTDVSLPITATSASGASKEGQATCTSILSLVSTGDCSVETAAKNGKIQSIKSVDSKVFSVLGFYNTYTTIVRGN
ncbi:TRL-like family protein [Helicobacter sp.]|uniref:TRL-like family protein n=1 Tax=Helicobacter sp. TaxID=218 RepID=UPI0025B9CFA2|nr:TRL-like family protein [Helicobacter sp.]MBR2494673.1 TRL-like family protein [Helicobacter sp.]